MAPPVPVSKPTEEERIRNAVRRIAERSLELSESRNKVQMPDWTGSVASAQGPMSYPRFPSGKPFRERIGELGLASKNLDDVQLETGVMDAEWRMLRDNIRDDGAREMGLETADHAMAGMFSDLGDPQQRVERAREIWHDIQDARKQGDNWWDQGLPDEMKVPPQPDTWNAPQHFVSEPEADKIAKDPKYNTPLPKGQEAAYAAWKAKNAPKDSGYDYDLQGAYLAGLNRDPATEHFDDQFKKPNHPTFSTFSNYAKDRPDLAGTWNGDTYVPPKGATTVADPHSKPDEQSPDLRPKAGSPPPLSQSMQPTGQQSWTEYLQRPDVKAGLLQFGMSMLAGVGNGRGLTSNFGSAGLQGIEAMAKAAHPELDPRTLEQQRLQLAANKPYWDYALAQQGIQGQEDVIGLQSTEAQRREAAAAAADKAGIEARGGLQSQAHGYQMEETGAASSARRGEIQMSSDLATQRQKEETALHITEAEHKQMLDLGVLMARKNGIISGMDAQEVELFKTAMSAVTPIVGFRPDPKSAIPVDQQQQAYMEDLVAKAGAMYNLQKNVLGYGATTVVPPAAAPAPPLPTPPMPPVAPF